MYGSFFEYSDLKQNQKKQLTGLFLVFSDLVLKLKKGKRNKQINGICVSVFCVLVFYTRNRKTKIDTCIVIVYTRSQNAAKKKEPTTLTSNRLSNYI